MKTDIQTGAPTTKPRRINNWAGSLIIGLSGTADGKRLVFNKRIRQFDVYVAELETHGTRLKGPRRLTLDDRHDLPYAWTPDSKAVLFASDRNGGVDIFKQAVDQDSAEPIVAGHEPRLSPNGAWILYLDLASSPKLMRVPISGGAPQLVLETRGEHGCARSPATLCVLGEETTDRKQLVITAFDPIQGRGAELTRTEIDPAGSYSWALSPDGSFVAVIRDEGHDSRIRFLPLADRKMHDVVVKGWTNLPLMDWSADGKSLFVGSRSERGAATLLNVDLEGHVHVLWEVRLGQTWGIPSPDGRYLALLGGTQDSNVWMLENF